MSIKVKVIYSDGGTYQSNPSCVGYGYFSYDYIVDAEVKTRHFPIKGLTPTIVGFQSDQEVLKEKLKSDISKEEMVKLLREDKVPYHPVEAVNMREYAHGTGLVESNAWAEVLGLKAVLKAVLESDVDIALVYADSTYVLKGLKHLDRIASRGFNNTSGNPIAFREDWREIHEIVNRIREKRIEVIEKWIPGHADKSNPVANTLADNMASLGAAMSANKRHGIDSIDTIDQEVTLESLKEDKDPEAIHPFLSNKRLYLGFGGRTDKHYFYVGSPGHQVEDIFIGKYIADAHFGVVYLKERNDTIETIEEMQMKWLDAKYGYHNLIFTLMLDNISNRKIHRKLNKYREAYLSHAKGSASLNSADGNEITYVNDPVYLSSRNIEILNTLSTVLNHYRDGTYPIVGHDITHLLYKTEEKIVTTSLEGKTDDKVIVGTSLLTEHGTGMKTLKPKIPMGSVEKEIILVCGIDMLKRNQLKNIDHMYPNVKLLVYNHGDNLYRIAFLVTLHDKCNDDRLSVRDFGIWQGLSSQVVLGSHEV